MKTFVKNFDGVANQFIIESGNKITFQSYASNIATIEVRDGKQIVTIGKDWDYSKTTGKYRNRFLGETKKETEAKIKSGEYIYDENL